MRGKRGEREKKKEGNGKRSKKREREKGERGRVMYISYNCRSANIGPFKILHLYLLF